MNESQPPPNFGLDEQGLPIGYPLKTEWEITPREVRGLLAQRGASSDQRTQLAPNSGALILDCRRPDEHQFCRLDGSLLIPLSELEQRADELETEEGSRSHLIVVYCHTGRRSLRAVTTLRALGFSRAVSMAGGIDLWSIDIDPSVPRY